MRALITGGAGFIGSNLVRGLLASGASVLVLDDLSTGSRANLEDISGDLDLIVGDIRNVAHVKRACESRDVVFHLAALPSVARSVEDPIASHQVNVDGTLNVLLASRDEGVGRVVFASSSSVYGDTPVLPKVEDMLQSPQSPYAAAKLAGESYCRAFARVYPLETVSVRFFNVFGPRQDPTSHYAAVIPRFINRMLVGEQPVIFGDGHQSRDFTYIANAVEACVLAAEAGPNAVGEFMNIGCGTRITLLELVTAINGILGTEIAPDFAAARSGDVRHSQASIDKARRLIRYEPLVGLEDGLKRTCEWLSQRALADAQR